MFDHYAPSPTIEASRNHREMRLFRQEQGLTHHFDINAGICHQVMPEAGLVYPGMILVATDSHTTTHGAFGCLGTGIGATDMATVLITGNSGSGCRKLYGYTWKACREACASKGRDFVYHRENEADGAVYKAIEFTRPLCGTAGCGWAHGALQHGG